MSHPFVRQASILALIVAGALAGCATVPELGAPPAPAPAERFESGKSFAAQAVAWPTEDWWRVYGDSQLDRLMDEALTGAPSLAAAAARLRQAEAAVEAAGAYRTPQAAAQAAATLTHQHLAADDVPATLAAALPHGWRLRSQGELQIAYQLDFFGRNRANLAAAISTTEAAKAEAAEARLQLSTAVAGAYADLQRQFADLETAKDIVRLRQDSLDLVQSRARSGLEREAQVEQARSELAQAAEELASSQGAIGRTRNALSALLGLGPDAGLAIVAGPAPSLRPVGLPPDIKLALVGRRPDVAAARLTAQAAALQVKVARAEFYPNVSLTALLSAQLLGVSRIGGGLLSTADAGPTLSLPIFSGGRLEGAYRGAGAAYDEAIASYNQTLANAFAEVANALNDRRTLDAELVQARAAAKAAEAAHAEQRQRYAGGLASYFDTLATEDSLVARRRTLADLEAQAFSLDIALVRALGGGFTAA